MAIKKAQQIVKESGDLAIPLQLRNAPTKLMKNLNYGKGYKYSHEGENNFIDQNFMPEELANSIIFDPGDNTREHEMRKRLKHLWKNRYNY